MHDNRTKLTNCLTFLLISFRKKKNVIADILIIAKSVDKFKKKSGIKFVNQNKSVTWSAA